MARIGHLLISVLSVVFLSTASLAQSEQSVVAKLVGPEAAAVLASKVAAAYDGQTPEVQETMIELAKAAVLGDAVSSLELDKLITDPDLRALAAAAVRQKDQVNPDPKTVGLILVPIIVIALLLLAEETAE